MLASLRDRVAFTSVCSRRSGRSSSHTSAARSARTCEPPRRLATQQLADWGWGYETEASGTVALLVAELTANAVRHGRVRGRDFRMSLTLHAADPALRIEVTDARPDDRPPTPGTLPQSPPDEESGRGLLLVEALSTHWGVTNGDPYTKTVWCEVLLN
ncbi:ATP-binding protein [Streptomyces sp. NPDC085995]|uniref:ATP-binding protein n=1 Tax=Streptomyces sp. NPDC085995 TaxID=3154861 RepID=UPI003442592D